MKLRHFIKAIYGAWLVSAWYVSAPAILNGASIASAPVIGLVAFSLIVAGLFANKGLAWLASPIPALFVAVVGIPWFINNLATSFGLEWYHDSPGLATTLLIGFALPGAALLVLVLLWRERRTVLSVFRDDAGAV